MRKLLIVILLVTGSVLYGQQSIRLGVNLDPVATWFSTKNKEISRDGIRAGIGGGLLVEAYFHPNYAFATGLNLGILGGNLTYEDSISITTGEEDEVMLAAGTTVAYNLSYLTIPLSLKLRTNEIGYMTWYAQLGFAPRFNTGSWANSTGEQLTKDFVGKEINLIDISYFIGAGVEYGIGGQTALTTGIFFHNGFTDVLSMNEYKATINHLSLRLGVMF